MTFVSSTAYIITIINERKDKLTIMGHETSKCKGTVTIKPRRVMVCFPIVPRSRYSCPVCTTFIAQSDIQLKLNKKIG